MKRIEATIQIDKTGAVSESIKDIVGGFTILERNGRDSIRHTYGICDNSFGQH